MGIEYKIKFPIPEGYDASQLFARLPVPIERDEMSRIYSYVIDIDGFYFVDHLINSSVASHALRLFIDEALCFSESIEIVEP